MLTSSLTCLSSLLSPSLPPSPPQLVLSYDVTYLTPTFLSADVKALDGTKAEEVGERESGGVREEKRESEGEVAEDLQMDSFDASRPLPLPSLLLPSPSDGEIGREAEAQEGMKVI